MTSSRVVSSSLCLPLLVALLFSLAHCDSRDDFNKLRQCRNCIVPSLYSPRWMGVDIVKYTSRPCKWIECNGNHELWVNGKNYKMNKLKCDNGQFKPMQFTLNTHHQTAAMKGAGDRDDGLREVMCVIPKVSGYYDVLGNWTNKENARCGVNKIHFDIGCDRNEFFSPFVNCVEAAVTEDSIQCPEGYTMNTMLKTLPIVLETEKIQCHGEEWKVHLPDNKTLDHTVTRMDSVVTVRCTKYQRPPGNNFIMEFVWAGFLGVIFGVGIYRCLSVHGVQDIFAFLREAQG
ncbi:hypothetical protein PRIPAC_91359 [Pristionchus pacificus]|uniref:Uncharacterized protein n=1 Tax=Pristionchus pacificus TaxID=54126 RepID=A0A2A6B3W5_PRIPA|nr:hypothetical protein PRIPAC_91359 [Pristionchus pacificus]|eukprot:PDM60551.1 hypothetical protein PRIPAC_53529 [Pristionchus pacificus]